MKVPNTLLWKMQPYIVTVRNKELVYQGHAVHRTLVATVGLYDGYNAR